MNHPPLEHDSEFRFYNSIAAVPVPGRHEIEVNSREQLRRPSVEEAARISLILEEGRVSASVKSVLRKHELPSA